jgi:tRNA modification GTPase
MDESDLLLVVLDGSVEPDRRVLAETAGRPRVLVRAKSDLRTHEAAAALPEAQPVSALTDEGMEALRERLTREVELRAGASGDEGGIVMSVRQIALIESLHTELAGAEAALVDAPLEAALVDLNGALASAGRILGVDVSDAVLDRIFSAFCLGK